MKSSVDLSGQKQSLCENPWGGSALYGQILEILKKQEIQVISFDFFDTLVYRLSDTPTPLFIEVGRRLKKMGLLRPHLTEYEFKSLRIAAENIARHQALKTLSSSEVTLGEIYANLNGILVNVTGSMEVEVQTERDFCVLNPDVGTAIMELRKKGLTVGVISDTYLGKEDLKSILEWNGFPSDTLNFIITSSEHRVCKATGDLFKVFLSQMAVKEASCLHIGDNRQSDVKGATIAGIMALHYSRTTSYQSNVLIREDSITDRTPFYSSSLNAFRLIAGKNKVDIPQDYSFYFQVGAFLFGPCLARFIDWSVNEMQREGIDRALVFMREAYTLIPLYEYYNHVMRTNIDFQPFYVSRHAVNLASLFRMSAEELFFKTTKHRRPTPKKILEALELPYETIPEIPMNLMNEPLNDVERYSLCKILAGLPKYAYKIQSIAAKKRTDFMSYFMRLIEGGKKIAFIDIGFRGSTQASIEKILKHGQVDVRPVGMYLSTQYAAAENILEGSDIRSFLGKLGAIDDLYVFMKHPEALEASLIAPVGTTVGYAYDQERQEWIPLLEPINITEDQRQKKYFIRKGILAFYRVWLPFLKSRLEKGGFVSRLWLEEIDDQCRTILRRLFAFPTFEEASNLGTLYHEDNDGTSTGDYLVTSESRFRYRKEGIKGLIENGHVYWPQATIAVESQDLLVNMFSLKNYLSRLY